MFAQGILNGEVEPIFQVMQPGKDSLIGFVFI
jgi:hypothetical protein